MIRAPVHHRLIVGGMAATTVAVLIISAIRLWPVFQDYWTLRTATNAIFAADRERCHGIDDACSQLGKMGPRALPAIHALVEGVRKHPDCWDDESPAAEALVKIGPAAIPVFVDLLRDDDPRVRARAAEFLGEFRTEAQTIVPALTRTLKQDEKAQVCFRAACSLAKFGADAREAIPVLRAALEHEDNRVKSAASSAIKTIDPAALESELRN